jgi:hypothetical protein
MSHFSAEGISNDVANYITMALDPNVGILVRYLSKNVPDYAASLDRLEVELDQKLHDSNITLLELFHRVAIR